MEFKAFESYVLAERWRRFFAFSVDYFVLILVQFVGSQLGLLMASLFSDRTFYSGYPDSFIVGADLGRVFWGLAYLFINFGVVQGLTGATLGKRILGIQVVNEDGSPLGVSKSLGRSFLYLISFIPNGLGFLTIFFSKFHRGIHDMVCGTLVVLEKNQNLSQLPDNVIYLNDPALQVAERIQKDYEKEIRDRSA